MEPKSFLDLNVSPRPPPASTYVATGIQPKLEPLDEPPPASLDFSDDTPADSGHPSPESGGADSEFHRLSELFQSRLAQTQEVTPALPGPDPNSGAIVPVPNPEIGTVDAPPRAFRYQARSAELVRYTDLTLDDSRYYRDVVRQTRMLFDSLRVYAVAADEKQVAVMIAHRRRTRGDLKASTVMRDGGRWLNRDKRIVGDIPGVYVGDVFFFRMELCVVGLHGHPQAGIDYVPATQSPNGDPIATSIIVSGGYEDDEDSGDVIIYTGHGGQDKHNKQYMHQKLEHGNLALERSKYYGIEVRVIRGFKYDGSISGKVYVYDGLYQVTNAWFDMGKSGFGVYKFKLVRIKNQAEMGSATMKFAQRLKSRPLELRPTGYITLDMSKTKENYPVSLYNDIDRDQEPLNHDYLTSSILPPFVYNNPSMSSSGCKCLGGCVRSNCLCATRNCGEFAYDVHGILIRGKPLVFECGAHCSCPPNCRNRVTQNGVKYRFEVFRSRETEWGLRSLDMIQAGSFICEYSGVVFTREQVQLLTMNGDNLIYPNRFAEKWKEWGNLSPVFSDYACPAYPAPPPLDFAMDVSTMRNVACYVSHSLRPNVFVQLVLYDHNNTHFPRLMLFAMQNIPPMREISLDYGVVDDSMGKMAICYSDSR